MSIRTRNYFKNLFKRGYKPTQENFEDLFDSYVHQSEQNDLSFANQNEAATGTADDRVMSPLRVKQAIEAFAKLSKLTTLANEVDREIKTAIANLVGGAASGYDTLKELQRELQNNDSELTRLLSAVNNRYTKQDIDDFFEKGTNQGKKMVDWTRITGKPGIFPTSGRTHDHDDRYYTESQINLFLNRKADRTHSHSPAQVGLGNLPNNKSDSTYLNESNSLATSKAVKRLKDDTTEKLNNRADKNHKHTLDDIQSGGSANVQTGFIRLKDHRNRDVWFSFKNGFLIRVERNIGFGPDLDPYP